MFNFRAQNCKEDNSFIEASANIFLVLIAVLIMIGIISIFAYYIHTDNKSRPARQTHVPVVRRVPRCASVASASANGNQRQSDLELVRLEPTTENANSSSTCNNNNNEPSKCAPSSGKGRRTYHTQVSLSLETGDIISELNLARDKRDRETSTAHN